MGICSAYIYLRYKKRVAKHPKKINRNPFVQYLVYINEGKKMITVKKLILLTVSFFTPLIFCETYSYEIEEVESVDVSSGVEFTVWCGAVNKLDITADSEDDFRMSMKDKKLKIKRKNSSSWLFFSWGRNDVTADITLKNPPQFIELSAGSEGEMENCFKKEADLSLSVSSGSSFVIDEGSGSINELEVNMSSGSEIEIEEKLHINHLRLKASSGSNFEADDEVIIETSEVRVSSGASVEICGALEVSGKVSSGGSIEVAENTIRTGIRTSSGGRLDADC